MIAGLTPVMRTVTPLRMRHVRNSKTTADDPSARFLHVLRVVPVESSMSAGGSKSSGDPSFDTVKKPVHGDGP